MYDDVHRDQIMDARTGRVEVVTAVSSIMYRTIEYCT